MDVGSIDGCAGSVDQARGMGKLSVQHIRADDHTVSDIGVCANSDDICVRCRDIPWLEGPDNQQEVRIDQSSLDLSCRICQFLGKILNPKFPFISWNSYDQAIFSQRLGPRNGIKGSVRVGTSNISKSWTVVISNFAIETAREFLQPLLPPPLISFPSIRALLDECDSHHKDDCWLQHTYTVSHLRVIDCTTRDVINAPSKCEYVALSYVWGQSQSDIKEFSSTQDLPRTIEQSILVTRKLGFNYLWVDRYCINQASQQHRESQIFQMSTIYEMAQLTIVAAVGHDPTCGLPGVEPHRRSSEIIHTTFGSFYLSAFPRGLHQEAMQCLEVKLSPWSSRAWTLQEAMSSRRRLVFAENQVIFSCNTNTCFESGLSHSNNKLAMYFEWCHYDKLYWPQRSIQQACLIMEDYCERRLTYESDALNAIGSTLNSILKDNGYHIWGIPFHVPATMSDTIRPANSGLAASTDVSDSQMVNLYLGWGTRSKVFEIQNAYRRRGFPSWSPLGWSSRSVSWRCREPQPKVCYLNTLQGRKCLSACLRAARTDPARMSQHIALSLQTNVVHVNNHDTDLSYRVNVPIGEGFFYRTHAYWDDPVEMACDLKTAVIAEDKDGVHSLLLRPYEDHYERIGYAIVPKQTLTDLARQGKLYHDELSPKHLREVILGHNLSSWKGMARDNWWERTGFEEELIVLG